MEKILKKKAGGAPVITSYSIHYTKLYDGRTHQIRVHMNYLNHPILGDSVYGRASKLINRSYNFV